MTGNYTLRTGASENYRTHCRMDPNTGIGWTLALRVRGDDDKFRYDDPLWTDDNLENENEDPSDVKKRMKLRSFSVLSMASLMLVFHNREEETSHVANGLVSPSLKFLLSQPRVRPLSLNAATINALVPGSDIDENCIDEVASYARQDGKLKLRIGIVGDNQPRTGSCATSNSFVGVGAGGTGTFTALPGVSPPTAGAYQGLSNVKAIPVNVSVYVR
jgi:hypothetical protein